MNREEYVKYFNDRQPPESRKISSDCLIIFEKECNHSEPYYKFIDFMQKVREWIQTKNDKEWARITNEIQKRNRPTYDFYTYQKQIVIKPANAKPVLPYSETYIGKSKNKTYWAYEQKDRKKIYFSKKELLREFINIKLSKDNKEDLILHMMEKYGGSFIENINSEDIIDDFIKEQKILKEILKLVKEDREFPYRKTTKHDINCFISNNENFVIHQSNFIQRFNRSREKRPFFAPSRKTKNLYDYYDYPIYLIYNCLYDCLDESKKKESFVWKKCLCCEEWFYARQKNIKCCCPAHSAKERKKRYKEKINL